MNTRAPEPGPALTDRIIRLGIKVHRKLGPGLLEAIYQECLCWELHRDGLNVRREVPLPIVYDEMRFDKGYRADIIVDETVLLELKSVECILPVHKAQSADVSPLERLHRRPADEFQRRPAQGRVAPLHRAKRKAGTGAIFR